MPVRDTDEARGGRAGEATGIPSRLRTAELAREAEQLRRAEAILIALRWVVVLSWPAILFVTARPWDPRLVWPAYGAVLAYTVSVPLWVRRAARGIRAVAIGTTLIDAFGVTLMCAVTGGIYSDLYFAFHLATLATAMRFGIRETFAVLGLNAVLSAGLYVGAPGPIADLGLRLFYLFFVALMGGLLSREVRRSTREALREGDKATLLLSVIREITSTLDLEELLGRLLQEALRAIPCAGAAGVVLAPGGEGVERIVARGDLPPLDPQALRVSLQHGALARAREGPLVANDPAEAKDHLGSDPLAGLAQRNLAAFPIRRRRDLLGLFVLVDRDGLAGFADDEIALLRAVADEAAVAIENARLVDEVRAARDRHRELLWRTIGAGEEERRRIAGEIHDRVGAQIFEFYYAVRRSRDRLLERNPALADELAELEERARSCSQTLREVMNDLRPSVLDDLGFVEALRDAVSSLQALGDLTVRLHVDPSVRSVPSDIGTMFFRVLQEAVLNVRKHASARTLEIELRASGDRLALWIRDDGRGFDPTAVARGHYGLLYMRERAEACGGTLRIRSRPGGGTELCVEVPFEARPPEAA